MSDDLNLNKPRRRNTKEKIIDEAESLAALHGIEHLKLQDVADKIGIKLPSVYAHFSGREDILAAMGSRISKSLSQLYIARPGEPPMDTILRSVGELLELLCNRPAYFRLMLRDHSVPMGYDPLNHRAVVNQHFALPPEIREMTVRLQALIDKSCTAGHSMAAEDFAANIQGFLLVRLSWLPTCVAEDGRVFVDQGNLRMTLEQIVHHLLGA